MKITHEGVPGPDGRTVDAVGLTIGLFTEGIPADRIELALDRAFYTLAAELTGAAGENGRYEIDTCDSVAEESDDTEFFPVPELSYAFRCDWKTHDDNPKEA